MSLPETESVALSGGFGPNEEESRPLGCAEREEVGRDVRGLSKEMPAVNERLCALPPGGSPKLGFRRRRVSTSSNLFSFLSRFSISHVVISRARLWISARSESVSYIR